MPMSICRLSEDELLVTDGTRTLLIMSRKTHALEPTGVDGRIDIESSNFQNFLDNLCQGCDRYTQEKPAYTGKVCEGCNLAAEQFEEVR